MNIRTNILVTFLAVVIPCGLGLAALPVVLYDDFEDNDVSDWSIGPLRSDGLSEYYDPVRPDVHDGQIWGKGSGYSSPFYTWMVKPVEFNAEGGLSLEVVGHSGTSWPNQANVFLLASTWPREGYVYTGGGQFNGEIVGARPEGYHFMLYGESNQCVQLAKYYYVGDTQTYELLFSWSHNVVADQTYRLDRDGLGNWSLSYGNPDGSNMLPAPIGSVSDSTFNDFGYVGVDMYRNQSALDYIEVGAVPELVTVLLDIKPNSVNLKSKGLLPVVAYGSDQLDVTEIDLDSLLLNVLGPRVKPNGSPHVSFEDVDGDLLLDLVMHFEMQALALIIDPGTTELSLTGVLMDGTKFEGADAIRIVPDFNGDLMVNATDLAIMDQSYGTAGGGFELGDANADGFVDATDLALLRAGLGWSESAFGEPIPEPASLTLLGLGGLALLRRRKRRRQIMSHRISVLIVLLAAVTCAWAEDPYQVAWTAQIGTSDIDYSYSVAVDASGNAYISGRTDGNLGGTNAGITDAFLTKFDTSGNELWSQQIGTSTSDHSFSVAVDASGNTYISGWTGGSLGGTNAGAIDAFLTKFDVSGNELWSRQIGTPSDDQSLSLAVDASGNAYISGYTAGSLGGTNAGHDDPFLTKFDASGNELWSQQIGTSMWDRSNSVAVDASGNAYISGHTGGNLGGTNAGGFDAFLIKFDASGNELWSQQIGTSESDVGYSVAVDASGTVYISGTTYGSLGGANAGGGDAFLIKFDASGNELWSQQIGTSSDDYSLSVAVDASGNAYISGHTNGDLGGTNAGGLDAFLTKFDASGNELWSQQIGTPSSEDSNSVAVDAAGNAYITGTTFGSLGGTNAGSYDAFLVKFEVPEPATVLLDIKPGSDPNSVNLKSKGLLPVVAYGSEGLDLTEIDLDTLLLNDVGPRVKPNGSWHVSFEDVDGDSFLDLVMHFETQALGIEPGTTELALTGVLMDGTEFEGADAIRIVPDFNGDLMVNATDLAIMKQSYGAAGVGFELGDANADGFVDATDLALLQLDLSWSESAFGEPIPEPATLSLLALGGLGILKRRRS